ncbi:VOC family protein [Streptomyces sp. AV19]|uniref:VOC family protein n=1 Tax=Streptomyces sp. AV19 TaxID=2793068 RepID=UPI0018FF02CF|nr:VOC family protein [Streptomyces sp. AV19]MBH1935678.1 VOC family protein [Streptomyces sp. AV19]MDG4536047.1 VOC family protein [Streptomyces sp. AV19]
MAATEHARPGTPCWVSLQTADLTAAQKFYGAVLGWAFRPGSLGEDFCVALSGSRAVAGLANVARTMGVPVSWTCYFGVDDADAVASRVRERGGTVAVGPLAFGRGRAALAADPAGAVFGFWEGRVLRDWRIGHGAAPAWLELRTRDCFDAALFYSGVFLWDQSQETDVRYEDDVVLVSVAGHTVACLRGGGVEAAPDPKIRPRWHVYFRVGNVEKAVEAALLAGGSVAAEPGLSVVGHEATLCDPEGAIFTVTSGLPD